MRYMKYFRSAALSAATAAVVFAVFYSNECRAAGEMTLKYAGYNDNNEAVVNTHGFSVNYELNSKTKLSLSGTVDGITAASRMIPVIDGTPVAVVDEDGEVDGVTGATGVSTAQKTEYRKDYSVGIARRIKENTLSVMLDSSREDDYSSLSYFLSWTAEFNNRNNALSFAYSGFSDDLFPFGAAWRDTKASKIWDISFTSVLTPRSQLRLAGSYGMDEGYLSNPYHRILIDNFYFKERHPSVRDKIAAGLFYNLGFQGEKVSSVQFDYRYYDDNWDIHSNTFGIKYNRHLNDWLMGSLRGRYYIQNSAFFFKNVYPAEERFMSSDPKLAAFSSVLFGIGFVMEVTQNIAFEFSYEHYNHISGLDYNSIYQSISKSDLISDIVYVSTRLKI